MKIIPDLDGFEILTETPQDVLYLERLGFQKGLNQAVVVRMVKTAGIGHLNPHDEVGYRITIQPGAQPVL